jgi:hypothetical protein
VIVGLLELDWLEKIFCAVSQFPVYVLVGLINGANAIIAALGALVEEILDLLPGFPEIPGIPDEVADGAGWVAWFFPVGTVLSILTWFLAVWLVWQGVVIALRWAKASDE